MTTSIEHELAQLVAAERDRPEVGAQAADRVWSGVQARLEGAPHPASVPIAGTAWGFLSLIGVVALAGVALAGVALGGWALSRPARPVDAAHFDSIPTPALVVVSDAPVVPELRVSLPEAGPALPATDPPKAKPGKRENAGTVADELALIEKARTAIDRGRAGAALGALSTHRREFPKGAFLEEAAALRATALCESSKTDAGKTDAAKKATAAFLRRYPNSVHVSRVKACAEP